MANAFHALRFLDLSEMGVKRNASRHRDCGPPPVPASRTADQPITGGLLLKGILLPNDSVQTPLRIDTPAGIERPLRAARVTWWQIPAGEKVIDLAQLDARPDPGY